MLCNIVIEKFRSDEMTQRDDVFPEGKSNNVVTSHVTVTNVKNIILANCSVRCDRSEEVNHIVEDEFPNEEDGGRDSHLLAVLMCSTFMGEQMTECLV